MGNLKNLKNLPNGDLCRIFAKEKRRTILNRETVVPRGSSNKSL